jgi:hypothetical protein
MERVVIILITGFIVIVMVRFFRYASRKNPKADAAGNKILKLPKLFGIIGLLSFLAGLAVVVYGIIDFQIANIFAELFLFLALSLLGLPLVFMTWISRVWLNEKEISKTTMFGKKTTLEWSEVKHVKYARLIQELKISAGRKRISCSLYLIGFPELLKAVEKQTGFTKDKIGLAGYRP